MALIIVLVIFGPEDTAFEDGVSLQQLTPRTINRLTADSRLDFPFSNSSQDI